MKLERLQIENFRGVKGNYEFEPGGENAIIVGPNGSGKSSLLEAIDFLLTNEITHLDVKGMGSVKNGDVIPNVDSDGPCVVTGEFADEDEESQTLTRDAESRTLEPPEKELPSSLQKTIDTARQGQHILTRSDLLDLVIARPKSRREVLTELLNLPNVDERRLILKRTRNNIEEKQEAAKSSRSAIGERLQELVESDATKDSELRGEVLKTINELRNQFDAGPVDEIDPETVREDIKSPVDTVTTEALQREQPRRELERLAEWADRAEENIPDLLNQLETALEEFHDQESEAVDAQYLELFELGEELIEPDADICPLCQQRWAKDTPLVEEIRRRRKKLNKLSELKKAIAETQDELHEAFKDGLNPLKYLVKELDSETYPSIHTLEEFRDDLRTSADILTGDLVDNKDFGIERLPIVLDTKTDISLKTDDFTKSLQNLEKEATNVTDLTEVEKQYERISTIAEQWIERKKLDNRVSHLHTLERDADRALSAFVAA
jgi:DNA repair exonuclease SbcCD ATPase subunit